MSSERGAGKREAKGAGPRVLILDDEPMILMDMQFALKDEGAEPISERTVEQALARIDQSRPDAAILDVNLGKGATCAPVAERLHALNVPFVLHTGDLDRQGELASSLGAEVVPKPMPSHLVARRVLDLIHRQTT